MKGLLLKELYVWLKTRSFYILYFSVLVLFASARSTVSSIYSNSILIIVLGLSGKTFLDDEKCNWSNYSRTLPYTSAQIVSSKYIISIAEALIVAVVSIISTGRTLLNNTENIYTLGLFENWSYPYINVESVIVSGTVIPLAIILIGLAFILPVNFRFTGTKRTVISLIPSVLCTILLMGFTLRSTLAYSSPEDFSIVGKIFHYEKWVPYVLIGVSVLLIAASWLISIAIHSNGKTKIFRIIAAIIVASAVTVSAVSVGILYSRGRLIKEEFVPHYETVDPEPEPDPSIPTEQNLNAREGMTYLLENFFIESHLGDNLKNISEKLEELGLTENKYDEFVSDKYGTLVRVYTESESDRVHTINISATVGDTYIESASEADMKKISDNFVIGMSENEMLEKFTELGLYPRIMSDRDVYDGVPIRYYWVQYYIGDYNNNGPFDYAINIDLSDGKIIDIRIYEDAKTIF